MPKTSGSVSLSATGPGKVASNTVVVSILQPKLEQIEVTARSAVNPCEVVEFAAYGFYSNQPQLRQPLRGANWSFSGRYARLGPSSVRAIWPASDIAATVTADQLTQQTSVQVLPLPETSPYFPIEDVTIGPRVKVGASIQNRATEFYCQGDQPSSRTATAGIAWSSDSASVLSCTTTGACTGLKPGVANVILRYEDNEVTRRPVFVFAEQTAATPAGPSTTPAQPQRKLISLTITPASSAIRSGESVYFTVIATFADGTVEDVTGSSSISHGNPFARKDAGVYPISAMYQGVIGRGATVQVIKDDAAALQSGVAAECVTASDCPAEHDCMQNRCVRSGATSGGAPVSQAACPPGQVRARDGSCVGEVAVGSALESYAQRQGQGRQDFPPATTSNVYVGALPGGGRFGPDTLREGVDQAVAAAGPGRERAAPPPPLPPDTREGATPAPGASPEADPAAGSGRASSTLSPAVPSSGGSVRPSTPTTTPMAGTPAATPAVTPAATTPAATVATPPKSPLPAGPYWATGTAPKCSQLAAPFTAQCTQIFQDCKKTNCAPPGYSGCEPDCGSCNAGWVFNDYWCQLHPSYVSTASAIAATNVAASRACVTRFQTDRSPGRMTVQGQCLGVARKQLDDSYNAAVAQACQARCAQDGRRGVVKTSPHRCECEK